MLGIEFYETLFIIAPVAHISGIFGHSRYYHKLDYESDRQLVKASCCAMWDARDCQLKAARKLCSSDAVGELYMAWEEGILSWSQSNECWDYRFSYNSANCKLADWAIALIVVGGILVICLVVFAVIKCCRMRNRKKTIVFNSVNYNRP